eukprot:CAMPEP_0181432616 /NCGR_PEP_ID=MMETSP1110-20121109/18862_1 /TAXON_ID=174948 /ORGANISM="Symbiodinium sp., Strain CCMP421" /LENGTH=85 /DNA_ID=CAMNT_0023556031 /DNA_START=133 /DNA_END=390 /DNA_ORIENTATION=+
MIFATRPTSRSRTGLRTLRKCSHSQCDGCGVQCSCVRDREEGGRDESEPDLTDAADRDVVRRGPGLLGLDWPVAGLSKALVKPSP